MTTSLALVHDGSAPALSRKDHLRVKDGEPRVRDMDIAERLGLAQPRNIRGTIEANRAELEGYGPLHAENAMVEIGSGARRENIEYWLNEGQALVICALSRTPQAAAVRRQLIEVFMAWRRGQLPPAASAAQPQKRRATQLTGKDAKAIQQRALAMARADYRRYSRELVAAAKEELEVHGSVDVTALRPDLHFADFSRPHQALDALPARKELEPGVPVDLDKRIADGVAQDVARSLRAALRIEAAAVPPIAEPAPVADPPLDLLYGVPAIAEYMGLSVGQVRHLVEAGRLKSFKIGGRVCARRADIGAAIEAMAMGGRANG